VVFIHGWLDRLTLIIHLGRRNILARVIAKTTSPLSIKTVMAITSRRNTSILEPKSTSQFKKRATGSRKVALEVVLSFYADLQNPMEAAITVSARIFVPFIVLFLECCGLMNRDKRALCSKSCVVNLSNMHPA